MIVLEELVKKISDIFNGLDDETSSIFNPATSFKFLVNSYGTHLDSIANKSTKKDVIPIYISNFSGTIEPIPHLREENTQYDFFIYFPIRYKETFFKLANFIVECFTGKMLFFGNESGNAITNLNVPSLQDLQQVDMLQFGDFLKETFGLPVSRTDIWGVMTFTLYCHQVANLGLTNGFIIGNQVSHEMSFTFENKVYNEKLIVVSSARNLSADTISEQKINALQTSGIAKNTSYIDSIQAYARDNEFWRKFIYLYELGKLQNMTFDYKKTYSLSAKMSFTKKAYLTQCPTSDDLGQAKTFTFTFIKPISEIDTDTSVIETKLRIPETQASAIYEDYNLSGATTIRSYAKWQEVPWLEDPLGDGQATWEDFGYLEQPTSVAYAKWFDFGRLNEEPTYNALSVFEDFGYLDQPLNELRAIYQDYGYLDIPKINAHSIYEDYGYLDVATIQASSLFENVGYLDSATTKAKSIYQDYGYLDVFTYVSNALYQDYGYLDIPMSDSQAMYQEFGYLSQPMASATSVYEDQNSLDMALGEARAMYQEIETAQPPIVTDIRFVPDLPKNQLTISNLNWTAKEEGDPLMNYIKGFETKQEHNIQEVVNDQLTNRYMKVKSGITFENGDVHLHVFGKHRVDFNTSYAYSLYMFGRASTSTTFKDNVPAGTMNVIQVNSAPVGKKGVRLCFAKDSSSYVAIDRDLVSYKEYVIKNNDLIDGEILYYDLNFGKWTDPSFQNTNWIAGFNFVETLNTNFKMNCVGRDKVYTLHNNGEYQ